MANIISGAVGLLFLPIVCSLQLYTISAPQYIKSFSDYRVVVSVHSGSYASTVTASIRYSAVQNINAPNSTQGALIHRGSVKVHPGEVHAISFKVTGLRPGFYKLEVDGYGGVSFMESSPLIVANKTSSVLIQTEKAIYKPGDLVRFRLIAIDRYLKPIETRALEIQIRDPQGNRIKKWEREKVTNGMFHGDLLLSDQPVLGGWSISAEVQGDKSTKTFIVEEYVAPTFDVTIRLPPYATYNDSVVVATIIAKYPYGKNVQGFVKLSVTENPCSEHGHCRARGISHTAVIDGQTDIIISLEDFFDYTVTKELTTSSTIYFTANITDIATNQSEIRNAHLPLHISRTKIQILPMSESFKPGLPYTVMVKLSFHDDIPVRDLDPYESVLVTVSAHLNSGEPQISNYTFNSTDDGVITMDVFPISNQFLKEINISARYKDSFHEIRVPRIKTASNRFLMLDSITETPKVNKEMEMEVLTTEPITHFVYMVVGRGLILLADKILRHDEERVHTFKFKVTNEMIPKVRVLAYYMSRTGEVVGDALDLDFEQTFSTKVAISSNVNVTQPGGPTELYVDSRIHTFVSLLAIDQRVLLKPGGGNDITELEVLNELQQYETGDFRLRPTPGSKYYNRTTGDFASQLFEKCGMILFTNGALSKINRKQPGAGPSTPFPLPVPEPATTPLTYVFQSRDQITQEPPRVRSYFPEAWLWTNVTTGLGGRGTLTVHAPDFITSWVITGFAIHPESGLGISTETAKLSVFRPFFLDVSLPFGIVAGEIVAVKVLLFNYLRSSLEVKVTLENPMAAFEFLKSEQPDDDGNLSKMIEASANDAQEVTFTIRPLVLGYIDIKVTALTSVAGDGAHKKLLVKPIGLPSYNNLAVYLDLRNATDLVTSAEVLVPDEAIPGSEHVELSVIGDVMSPVVSNLQHLLRLPDGCGEQNMVNFVPNIAVLEYLRKTGQLSTDLYKRGVYFLQRGYQRELTYKRKDGSFSAFGDKDKFGSTWLTALVARSFQQASEYIDVDEAVISEALNWLRGRQMRNGSFEELGEVHMKALQGGSASSLALAAFVLTAFFGNTNPEFVAVTERGLKLLEYEIHALTDPYDLALTTYALHLANSPSRDAAYAKLQQAARHEGGLTYWLKSSYRAHRVEPLVLTGKPQAIDIETTSYALLSAVHRGDVISGLPILHWLISKRNELGGFMSTQDTVVAIQAFAKMAVRIAPSKSTSMAVTIHHDGGSKSLAVNRDNALMMQKIVFPSNARRVNISASGKGFAVAQLSWSYYTGNNSLPEIFFRLSTQTEFNYIGRLKIKVCTELLEEGTSSNMAVIEVNLPSGYVMDGNDLGSVHVKRLDKKNQNTRLIYYLDKIENRLCIDTTARKVHVVSDLQPAVIACYDYYEPHKRAEALYTIPE